MMRIILLGVPGAGKGTQAQFSDRAVTASRRSPPATCCARKSKAGTPLGIEAKKYMDTGTLVPDELVIATGEAAASRSPIARRASSSTAFRARSRRPRRMRKAGVDIDFVVEIEVGRCRNHAPHERPPRASRVGPHLSRRFQSAQGGRQGRLTGEALVQRRTTTRRPSSGASRAITSRPSRSSITTRNGRKAATRARRIT